MVSFIVSDTHHDIENYSFHSLQMDYIFSEIHVNLSQGYCNHVQSSQMEFLL